MNPWTCAVLIAVAGGLGGVVNALISDNGFILPRTRRGIWCLGFISNVLVGAFAAFSSWSFYGSGAGVDLALITEQTQDQPSVFRSGRGLFGGRRRRQMDNERS